MKILFAVDDSPISTRTTKHATKLTRQLAEPAELVLFYTALPVMTVR